MSPSLKRQPRWSGAPGDPSPEEKRDFILQMVDELAQMAEDCGETWIAARLRTIGAREAAEDATSH